MAQEMMGKRNGKEEKRTRKGKKKRLFAKSGWNQPADSIAERSLLQSRNWPGLKEERRLRSSFFATNKSRTNSIGRSGLSNAAFPTLAQNSSSPAIMRHSLCDAAFACRQRSSSILTGRLIFISLTTNVVKQLHPSVRVNRPMRSVLRHLGLIPARFSNCRKKTEEASGKGGDRREVCPFRPR